MHIAVVGPTNTEEFTGYLSSPGPLPVGLGGTAVTELVHSLLALGHKVSLITVSPEIGDTYRAEGPMLDVAVVPYRKRARRRAIDLFAKERRYLAEEISKSGAEVIHAHWTYEFALAALSVKVTPVLVTARDAPLTILRHSPDAYRFARTIMAYAARTQIRSLTAVSPEFARRWQRQMFYCREISVIPNPFPALKVDAELRSATPVIIGVGDASRRKNYRALLTALPLVRAVHKDAVLRLVGPGLGPQGPLAVWAKENRLDDAVTFVGAVGRTELAHELSVATVFCHPSLEESFGNVILEAILAGLPVVAGSSSGGVPWVLFDGRAGALVNVRDPERIAQALIAAINDPSSTVSADFDLSEEMQKRYSRESVARSYVSEYQRLLRLQSKDD